jgi:UDP-glucose 4-epimerase
MINSVLLTGALGYIGGRLAQALVADGYSLTCGTRRTIMQSPEWLRNAQMAHLDWDSLESLTKACSGMDCVIHLAAMNEVDSIEDPLGALRINGLASLRLLEAAKLAGVRRFIYFSTAHVYGSPLQGRITEMSLPRPVHPYAITHKVAEDFLLAAHDQKQIEGVVIRLSNGFGAPATSDINRWTLLVNDLCRQASISRELRLNSPGLQLRDFITLGDVAQAVKHLLQLDAPQLEDGLFNLGGGKSMSILSMAELIAARWSALTGDEIPIIRPSGNAISPPALSYCSDKLGATGFLPTPQFDLEIDDTLKLCLRSFGG